MSKRQKSEIQAAPQPTEAPAAQAKSKKIAMGLPPRPVQEQPVAFLASSTGTSATLISALKAAFGWTDQTRLTKAEFLKKRSEWLQRPAKEN